MVKAKLELLSYRPGDLRDPRTFPRCSRATSSRYSVPAGSSRCTRCFLLLVTNLGRFPELTPVRSQVIELWLATLEAGDSIHPGPTWMRYDPRNPEHYRLKIPEHDHMTSAARYIRYVFDGEETILEGCDSKQTPIYRKALHARSADTRPNLRDDKLIRDDHLHVLHPQATLKEL